jgi:hypothetical protein
MEQATILTETGNRKRKLFLGGDRAQHIGWVAVHNGVNVIEYTDQHTSHKADNFLILQIGDSLKEECFGAFDRSKHKLPY